MTELKWEKAKIKPTMCPGVTNPGLCLTCHICQIGCHICVGKKERQIDMMELIGGKEKWSRL